MICDKSSYNRTNTYSQSENAHHDTEVEWPFPEWCDQTNDTQRSLKYSSSTHARQCPTGDEDWRARSAGTYY